MPLDGGANELRQEDRLADPRSSEQAGLSAARERREQVDDLDAGLKDLAAVRLLVKRRRGAVDRPAWRVSGKRGQVIDRAAEDVDETAKSVLAHRNRDRRAGRLDAAPRGGAPR